MTGREHAMNQDLRALDDAHRLGCFSRAEYRAHRRRLLTSLLGEGITARQAVGGARRASCGRPMRVEPAHWRAWAKSRDLPIALITALVGALIAWGVTAF